MRVFVEGQGSGLAKFDLVVFDLDGTLIDAFEDIRDAANHIRERNGLADLPLHEVKLHVGHGARYLVQGVLETEEEAIIDANLQELIWFYENLTESKARLYEGVVATLQRLQAMGIRTAIASNKPHSVTLKVADEFALADHLDFVRGEAPDIRRKPEPDVLLYLMKQAAAAPDRTLMVGDTEIDIACARAAGTPVAAVTYGQHDREKLAGCRPDYLLDSLSDVLEIVGD